MSHTHWPNDLYPDGVTPAPVCKFSTIKACDANFKVWEDDQQVALAAMADPARHKDRSPDANLYSQVVQVLNGTRDDLQSKGGNVNMGHAAIRLRAAIARHRASADAGSGR